MKEFAAAIKKQGSRTILMIVGNEICPLTHDQSIALLLGAISIRDVVTTHNHQKAPTLSLVATKEA